VTVHSAHRLVGEAGRQLFQEIRPEYGIGIGEDQNITGQLLHRLVLGIGFSGGFGRPKKPHPGIGVGTHQVVRTIV